MAECLAAGRADAEQLRKPMENPELAPDMQYASVLIRLQIGEFQQRVSDYKARRVAHTRLPSELIAERDRLLRCVRRLAAHGVAITREELFLSDWYYPFRATEIGHVFETCAKLHLPGDRRPTLSEYDNRRTGTPQDRYYYGIYRADS